MTDLLQALQSDADQLRRELESTITQCQQALARMDEGSRPGTSITGRLLTSTSDVERLGGRIDLLLNYAGSDLLPHGAATKALQKGRRR